MLIGDYFVDRQSLIQYGATCANYVTTVFLLDTSTSMSGEGLEQMKKSFKDIINGTVQRKITHKCTFARGNISCYGRVDIFSCMNLQICFPNQINILSEFSKHPSIAENVSVITFGEEVKIRHYYSNDYGSITRCVGKSMC